MLRELEVASLGIIDHVRLELPSGFVALTGETGAGKSLLVQSLQLLAGERADSEQVRAGAERLLVQGRFSAPVDGAAAALLDEIGAAGGDELLIRREVSAGGRSRAWINDVPVTVASLQRLAPSLLAIHGQHEQRGLADPSTHLALVDRAGGLEALRASVAGGFAAWRSVRAALDEARRSLASRRDRLDAIAYQLSEIDEAQPDEGEDETLREERALLRHAGRIGELLGSARAALAGEGGSVGLARAARAASELAELGLQIADAAEALGQAQILAEDAERALVALSDRVRIDPLRLEAVEARLVALERLARKYGGSLAAVRAHHAELIAERGRLEGVEEDIGRLEDEVEQAAQAYLDVALELSERRGQAARDWAAELEAVLAGLGMDRVRLDLRLTRARSDSGPMTLDGGVVEPGPEGIDTGELLISTNPGEPPRPLARIASGGELSRIHLAIRTTLRERAGAEAMTLLFDEVDAGIGGRVADELGTLLAALGRRDQVLVVTHLPQVAAQAAGQLVVSKHAAGERTVTEVRAVEGEARVEELVRMLGGREAAREHARELLGRVT